MLRNNWYREIVARVALSSATTGEIYSAAGGKGVSAIGRDDCALAAAAALTRGPHGEEVLEMTGRRAVTFDELTRLAAAVLGKEVKHVQLDGGAFAKALEKGGLPAPLIPVFVSFHAAIADGRLGIVSPDFKGLTERDPTPIEAYMKA